MIVFKNKIKKIRSINISELALSSCVLSNDGKSIFVGSWDNNVYIYSIEYGRVLDTISGHDDAVSAIQLKGTMLFTASWDSTLKLWKCPISEGESKKSTRVAEYVEHESEVKCVDFSLENGMGVSGGMDGVIVLWDIGTQNKPGTNEILENFEAHHGAVTCVKWIENGKKLISSGQDGMVNIYSCKIEEEDDERRRVRLIEEIKVLVDDEGVNCVLWNDQIALAGTQSGNLVVVLPFNLSESGSQIAKTISAHPGLILIYK